MLNIIISNFDISIIFCKFVLQNKKISMKLVMNIAGTIKIDRGVDALTGSDWYG